MTNHYALKRHAHESYLDAAVRYAARAPLVTERRLLAMAVRDSYRINVDDGMDPCAAALFAAIEVGVVTPHDVHARPSLMSRIRGFVVRKVWWL